MYDISLRHVFLAQRFNDRRFSQRHPEDLNDAVQNSLGQASWLAEQDICNMILLFVFHERTNILGERVHHCIRISCFLVSYPR